jgi:hypothetical protein
MNNVWMVNINVTVTEMKSMEQYSDHADIGISYASNRLYQVITIKLLKEQLLNYIIRLTAKYTNSYWDRR